MRWSATGTHSAHCALWSRFLSDHLGEGAITAVEYVISCEDGWFLGKNEAAYIPGTDLNNGAPGITLALDTEADKSCAAGS